MANIVVEFVFGSISITSSLLGFLEPMFWEIWSKCTFYILHIRQIWTKIVPRLKYVLPVGSFSIRFWPFPIQRGVNMSVWAEGSNYVVKLSERFQALSQYLMTPNCQTFSWLDMKKISEQIGENCIKIDLIEAEKLSWTHKSFACSIFSILAVQPINDQTIHREKGERSKRHFSDVKSCKIATKITKQGGWDKKRILLTSS